MHTVFPVEAGNFTKAGNVSSDVKRMLKQLGVPHKTVKRIVVALFEAEVNVIAHSWGGQVEITVDPKQVLVRVVDTGPGIPDLDLAMTEGFSTASEEVREMGYGAGMGLPNIRNNADELKIETGANSHTDIHMTFYIDEE
ncbi:MAG: ATP-binding protein [Spirochaetales bacterium]|nr:ATP-binding protein [Spirochaetales bacterium]